MSETPETNLESHPKQPPIKDRGTIFARYRGFLGATVGGLLGIIGIVLSVYFYLQSKEYPELTYYVHPVKASVLRSNQASDLQCTFKEQFVTSDITIAQMAFWNEGKRSIKRDNILKPIVLLTPNAPILEASLRKQSRDVVNLEIDRSELQKGRLGLSWTILERNDGAVIQLTYAGSSDLTISVDGVIEGQGTPRRVDYSGKLASPQEQYQSSLSERRTTRWLILILGFANVLMVPLLGWVQRKTSHDPLGKVLRIVTLLVGISLIGYFILRYFSRDYSGPPFGFD